MADKQRSADGPEHVRRTLVTGAAGFVGRWLVPTLLERGDEVVGVRLPEEHDPPDGPRWVAADLGNAKLTTSLLNDLRPDRIVHLAAVSFPPDAEQDPTEAFRVNYGAVDALLQGMARFCPQARLLYVGTGAAYGARPPDAPPFEEKDLLCPQDAYSESKAAAEQLCMTAAEHNGLHVIRARPLNHTGPGRPPQYVESSIAQQLVRIERGDQPAVLRVGNLEPIRDFSDVRDVVAAYELLLDRGEAGGVYNVCSGCGYSIRELLDRLVALSSVHPNLERDDALYRPTPPERLAMVGNPARLRRLGWEPRYRLDTTLRDLLEDWRSRP
jgi:GDP-4-dehydro-6-deoxy-D-mannose reductase